LDPGPAGSSGGTSPYQNAPPSYDDATPVTQTMKTPPYGENYGYGNGRHGAHAAPAGEPRRPGTRSYQGSHQATDSHQATGGYPGTGSYRTGSYLGTGSYPAGGGYPGNGHSVNGYRGHGHRAPYDPRDDYRRLIHQH
jgi:hypothetical protein